MSAEIIMLKRPNQAPQGFDEPKGNVVEELRRAKLRIAQLEANLTAAMQDNLTNYTRARDAERKLEELGV
jgi:hypothetical protein